MPDRLPDRGSWPDAGSGSGWCCSPCRALLVAVDITALFLALPRLSADLHASSVEQLWITDSYGFLVAGFVITMGTLGDRVGRRRLLLIGAAAFAAVSVAAAYSVSPLMLIIARGALGIAGATLAPSTLALISSMFRDARQRGQAIAVWATSQFVGGAAGPVLAGLLLQHFWWGSVFLMAVPVMLLLLIAGPAILPEYRNPAPAGWTWPASGCPWRPCCWWCTGSSSWRSAGRPAWPRRSGRSPQAPRSAWSSRGASSGSRPRC